MTKEERKEQRQEERRREREEEKAKMEKKEAKKRAKEMAEKNEMANEMCSPLKEMIIKKSGMVCRFQRWQLDEMMKWGENFTCFEEMKNTLLEKADNMTKLFSNGNMSMDDMEGMYGRLMELMGDKMDEEVDEPDCDRECRKERRREEKRQQKQDEKKGDDDWMDDWEPDFGMDMEKELGMEDFMAAVNVTDMEGLKNLPFKDMIDNLGKCRKCENKPEGCLKLSAWYYSKIRMVNLMKAAIKKNNNECTGIKEVLMQEFMDMVQDMIAEYGMED